MSGRQPPITPFGDFFLHFNKTKVFKLKKKKISLFYYLEMISYFLRLQSFPSACGVALGMSFP